MRIWQSQGHVRAISVGLARRNARFAGKHTIWCWWLRGDWMEARPGPREAHSQGAPEDSWIMSGRQVCARVGGGALGCLVQVWATNIFDPVTWRVASLRWDRDHVKRTLRARRRTAGSRGGAEYGLVQGPWCVCSQARCGPDCTRGLAAGGLSV